MVDNFGLAGTPNRNTKVQLTLAGLWALRFDELPRLYVALLRLCNQRWEQVPLSGTEVQYAIITSDEVRQALFPGRPRTPARTNGWRSSSSWLNSRNQPSRMLAASQTDHGS